MKTTFSRQFALIAALLLVCMIFTGVSFRFLMLGYLKNDKKETLSADAAAVASLAEAYDSTGELEENWDFRLKRSASGRSAASMTTGAILRAGPLSPMIRTRRSAMSSFPPT